MPNIAPFLTAAGSVFAVLAMIMTGYFLTKYKKINADTASFISFTVLNVALPAYMVHSIDSTFSSADLKTMPYYIAAPLTAILISYCLSWVITTLLKVDGKRKGLLIVVMAHTNTIFMGLPVNIAMFGESSVPYALYYYMANTITYWTLGVYVLSGRANEKRPFFTKETLMHIVSPPLMGLFIGLALSAMEVKLPTPIDDTLKYIGGLTTPLSMFFIGYVLCNSQITKMRIDKHIIYGLMMRFVAGPAINYAVFAFFTMPPLMRSVFLIQASMPVMANLAIVAHEYGSDSEFAAKICAISTAVSLVVLPIVKILV